ncbi:hypothetical protein MHU86_17676 [Fragilaria crotonensis]|nr:hypothetical protein MHU86_17676 [Fragilaria crotonensis]
MLEADSQQIIAKEDMTNTNTNHSLLPPTNLFAGYLPDHHQALLVSLHSSLPEPPHHPHVTFPQVPNYPPATNAYDLNHLIFSEAPTQPTDKLPQVPTCPPAVPTLEQKMDEKLLVQTLKESINSKASILKTTSRAERQMASYTLTQSMIALSPSISQGSNQSVDGNQAMLSVVQRNETGESIVRALQETVNRKPKIAKAKSKAKHQTDLRSSPKSKLVSSPKHHPVQGINTPIALQPPSSIENALQLTHQGESKLIEKGNNIAFRGDKQGANPVDIIQPQQNKRRARTQNCGDQENPEFMQHNKWQVVEEDEEE